MTEYIDVDMLKDAIRMQMVPDYTDRGYPFTPEENAINITMNNLIANIDRMPKYKSTPVEWTPCSKALPPYGEVVICLTEKDGITMSCITYENAKPSPLVFFGQHLVKGWIPKTILPRWEAQNENT